ncbi:DUF4845 domain-containing protein [Acidiferrobacter sp.]|uniref:DUF4845 domain-containing protein n=1 Tax=Acidiferrobacter sp. TaxID=1872107 RepID=UPI00262D4CAD|nr:DUF4845 domain-containing protein [Acidiferrobacter sp.]
MAWRRERGASLWSVLVFVVVVGFWVFVGFRIGPSYLNNWQIEKGLASVALQPGARTQDRQDLRAAVRREFSVGYVGQVSVHKDLHFERNAHGLRVMVFRYHVLIPIMGNASAYLDFVDRQTVTGAGN